MQSYVFARRRIDFFQHHAHGSGLGIARRLAELTLAVNTARLAQIPRVRVRAGQTARLAVLHRLLVAIAHFRIAFVVRTRVFGHRTARLATAHRRLALNRLVDSTHIVFRALVVVVARFRAELTLFAARLRRTVVALFRRTSRRTAGTAHIGAAATAHTRLYGQWNW